MILATKLGATGNMNSIALFQFVRRISSASTQRQTVPAIKVTDMASKIQQNAGDLNPLKFPDYFGVRNLFSLKDLFDARVHLGHKEGTLEPNMRPFVFGSRLGHLILDLDQTMYHLTEALNFAAHIAYRDGIILFVSQNPLHTLVVESAAKEAGEYAHCREWSRTILTNSVKLYGGITRLPDLCILMSTLNPLQEDHECVRDAAKMCIPTIGIVDTNSRPDLITYPVPGNDDSPQAIKLYSKLFCKAILLGKSKRKQSLS